MVLLSAYERKARLIPGFLAVAPVAVVIAAVGLKRFPAVAIVLGLLSATGGAYLLAVLVANYGRRVQRSLWEAWQGRPTTHLLRTREPADNPVERDLWRRALTRQTGLRLLSPAEEAADPAAADHAIEAAVGQVLHFGQDDRFPILLSEIAQYGLERNLFGFRWMGRAISAVCIGGLVVAVLLEDPQARGPLLAGVVVNGLFLAAWIFLPSAQRTKEAGFRYATQLLHAVVRAETSEKQSTDSQGNGEDS